MSDTEDQSQKTEEPSHKKLEQAREKGDVFTSKEVNSFTSILTLSLLIVLLSKFFTGELIGKLAKFITSPHEILASLNRNGGNGLSGNILNIIGDLIIDVMPFLIIPPLIMMIINIVSLMAQHGIIYSPEVIQFKLERISLIAGFKRIFSLNSIVELLKGVVKIIILGTIVYITIKEDMHKLAQSYQLSIVGGMQLIMEALVKVFIRICCFMFFLAVVDYLYQRSSYVNKMKMSKKELKDEHKNQEGNPEVRSKLKSMRAQFSKKRIMASVPNADVVITNPTHYAVALEFKPEKMDTPVVVAKGQDNIALMIRNIARKHNVPIVENRPLARLLFADLEMGMKIKEKHYKAVAEIIMYVMRLQKKQIKF